MQRHRLCTALLCAIALSACSTARENAAAEQDAAAAGAIVYPVAPPAAAGARVRCRDPRQRRRGCTRDGKSRPTSRCG